MSFLEGSLRTDQAAGYLIVHEARTMSELGEIKAAAPYDLQLQELPGKITVALVYLEGLV